MPERSRAGSIRPFRRRRVSGRSLGKSVAEGFGRVMLADTADVTQILSAIEAGVPNAAAELLPLVDELRKLTAARPAGSPGRPSRPPPRSARPTSGWSAASRARTGTATRAKADGETRGSGSFFGSLP